MAERTSDQDRTEKDREDRAKRLEEAANPSGDFTAPDAGVSRLPDEVAEEGSTAEANASIRDTLLEQSGRKESDSGQQTQAAQSQPEPTPVAQEEPAPAPRRTARHADEDK